MFLLIVTGMDVCFVEVCVIIEGIQGVGGLDEGTTEFFQALEKVCAQYDVILILDEVQSGYGRSGKFFAHQHHDIKADIICLASSETSFTVRFTNCSANDLTSAMFLFF